MPPSSTLFLPKQQKALLVFVQVLLAFSSCLQAMQIHFCIVHCIEMPVYCPLQNGQIFVFAGMLEVCGNDEQLGNVLAHEMAHCVLGHGVRHIATFLSL